MFHLRLVCVLLGLVLGIQSTGALRDFDEACAQSCPDDDQDGKCPPGCLDCACCGHVPAAIPSGVALATLAPPTVRARIQQTAIFPHTPDPAELLHVPRSLQA